MKKITLLCVCVVALSVSTGYAGIVFNTAPVRHVEMPQKPTLLKSRNIALEKALKVHNLLNTIPELEEMIEAEDLMKESAKIMEKFAKDMKKCGKMAFGGRYKNEDDVLNKAVDEYRKKSKEIEEEYRSQTDDSGLLPLSFTKGKDIREAKRKAGRAVFADVASNPKKYGAQLADKKGAAGTASEEENANDFNVLENIVQSDMSNHNAVLGQKDMLEARQRMVDKFVKELADVGLTYPDTDFMKRTDLVRARLDLKKLKTTLVSEAEEYIAKLDEQDAQYPELAARRAYRSANKQRVLTSMQQQYPDSMKGLAQMDQLTPQQQQKLIVEALKKDANGMVYLTETNFVDLDRKMEEVRAHQELMRHLKKAGRNMMPEKMADFDFSMCKV